jgi:hypothetical protein
VGPPGGHNGQLQMAHSMYDSADIGEDEVQIFEEIWNDGEEILEHIDRYCQQEILNGVCDVEVLNILYG